METAQKMDQYPFAKRNWSMAIARLNKASGTAQGTYTFDAFVLEDGKQLLQLEVKILPNNRNIFVSNFLDKVKENTPNEDQSIERIAKIIKTDFYSKFGKWNNKKSIEELSSNFYNQMMKNFLIQVPEKVEKLIANQIERFLNHPQMIVADKKGRPYFYESSTGRVWVREIGIVPENLYQHYGLEKI